MTNREQLLQELEQAPDELVQTMLDFLHRAKVTRKTHPLANFAGILSNDEAEDLKQSIATDCRQVEAKRVNSERYEAVLAKVPDMEPEAYDQLPPSLN